MPLPLDRSAVPDYRRLGLEGRAAVVLGGGNGIGRQVCHAFAQAGARVVCVDREAERAETCAAEIDGVALFGDITKRADVERIFAEADERVGPVGVAVDIVGMPYLEPLSAFDDAKWASQLDLVLTHAFLVMQIGGRAVAAAGGGALVFVASMSGQVYLEKQSAYGAAKAALIHLVACMGREYGPAKVRVNAVAPGFVRTPRLNSMLNEEQWQAIGEMVPRGKVGLPEEIAGPILFLASDLASYLTGQTLTVDGGITDFVRLPKLW